MTIFFLVHISTSGEHVLSCFPVSKSTQKSRTMESIKIKINDNELIFKMDLKTFMVYESMAGKPFKGGTTLDLVSLMYSALVAHNVMDLTFDKFVDYLDETPSLLGVMTDNITEYFTRRNESQD